MRVTYLGAHLSQPSRRRAYPSTELPPHLYINTEAARQFPAKRPSTQIIRVTDTIKYRPITWKYFIEFFCGRRVLCREGWGGGKARAPEWGGKRARGAEEAEEGEIKVQGRRPKAGRGRARGQSRGR